MGDALAAIRGYVGDMLVVTQAMLGPIRAQLEGDGLSSLEGAQWLLDRIYRMLAAHSDELQAHLRRLGGGEQRGAFSDLATELLDTATTRIGDEANLAKMLRDDYTALSLAHAGALMLETNARALGFASTAALASRHRDELLSMLRAIRDLLPVAVKGEIDAGNTTYNVAM